VTFRSGCARGQNYQLLVDATLKAERAMAVQPEFHERPGLGTSLGPASVVAF